MVSASSSSAGDGKPGRHRAEHRHRVQERSRQELAGRVFLQPPARNEARGELIRRIGGAKPHQPRQLSIARHTLLLPEEGPNLLDMRMWFHRHSVGEQMFTVKETFAHALTAMAVQPSLSHKTQGCSGL